MFGRWLLPSIVFSGALGLAFPGCASDASEAPDEVVSSAGGAAGAAGADGGGTGGSAAGGSSSGGGSMGGNGGSILIDAGPGDAADPDAACALITEKATASELNLYIMLDKSSSMTGFKWDAVKSGLQAFTSDPDSEGIRVALNFFPRPVDAQPGCSTQAYREPRVDYGALVAHGPSIMAAIDAEAPNGAGTPTYPALGGALNKAAELAQQNPDQTSAVLLITDGLPLGPATMCGAVDPEDPAAIAQLAANAYSGAAGIPPIATFVVGLEGVDSSFANQVAAAGGSDQAIIVSSTNAAQDFADALTKVRGQALPCDYAIPAEVAGGTVAFDLVNVLFTPGGASSGEVIPQTTDCNTADGWYYDNPSAPTRILLCDASCSRVKGDFNAQLDILLGCQTEVVK